MNHKHSNRRSVRTSPLDPAEYNHTEEELIELMNWSVGQGLYSDSPYLGTSLALCPPGVGPRIYEMVNGHGILGNGIFHVHELLLLLSRRAW